MNVVIFEDARWPLLAPLTLARPVFSLGTGACTLLEKQLRHLQPTRLTLWVRAGLEDFCRRHVLPGLKIPAGINTPLDDQPTLLVNGRAFFSSNFEPPRERTAAVETGQLLAAHVVAPGLSPKDALEGSEKWIDVLSLPSFGAPCRIASHLWDLIGWNEESIAQDALCSQHIGVPKPVGPYHLVNESAITIGPNSDISPGVVIDASKGPVVIDDNVTIGANAVLLGPCFIGQGATLSPHALIRAGTSIGALCKIGGEVSETIFMPCSNKAHDGFVGSSYVGQWVNFGAGATTSNLKNTYGEISIRLGGHLHPTGRRFLGSLVGDHTKFAIATRLMTGSYIGHCCMIASSGLTPTFVPSFTFLTDKGAAPYDHGKAKEVMKAVFHRRHRDWNSGDDAMLAFAAAAADVEG